MKLPDKILMTVKAFLDGENGFAQRSFYNEQFGITLMETRESRKHPPVRAWEIAKIPGETFSTYEDLRKAAEGL